MAKAPVKFKISPGRTIVLDKHGRPKALDKTPKPLRGARQRKQKRLVAGLMRAAENTDEVD